MGVRFTFNTLAYRAICGLVAASTLWACSATSGNGTLPAGSALVSKSQGSRILSFGLADTLPGFYVAATVPPRGGPGSMQYGVTEFAKNASGRAAPMRSLMLNGSMFGIDAQGNIYTSTIVPYSAFGCTNGACKVYVYSPSGANIRSFEIKQPPRDPMQNTAVDRAGQVYVSDNHSNRIDVYDASASGAPKPIRSISFPTVGPPGQGDVITPRPLYVDGLGKIYLAGRATTAQYNLPQVAVFGSKQDGAVVPQKTIIGKKIVGGPQAVGTDGSIWTVFSASFNGSDVGYKFGANARGLSSPAANLVIPGGTTYLTLTKQGDIAYVSPFSCTIRVLVPGSSAPKRIIQEGYNTNSCRTFIAVSF
jgi:hypothetical protein